MVSTAVVTKLLRVFMLEPWIIALYYLGIGQAKGGGDTAAACDACDASTKKSFTPKPMDRNGSTCTVTALNVTPNRESAPATPSARFEAASGRILERCYYVEMDGEGKVQRVLLPRAPNKAEEG